MTVYPLWMEAVKAAINTKPISRGSNELRDGAVPVSRKDHVYTGDSFPPLKRSPKPVRDIK